MRAAHPWRPVQTAHVARFCVGIILVVQWRRSFFRTVYTSISTTTLAFAVRTRLLPGMAKFSGWCRLE